MYRDKTDIQSSRLTEVTAKRTRKVKPSRNSTRIWPGTNRNRLTILRVAPTLAHRRRRAEKAPKSMKRAMREKTGTSWKLRLLATTKRSAASVARVVEAKMKTSSRKRSPKVVSAKFNCRSTVDEIAQIVTVCYGSPYRGAFLLEFFSQMEGAFRVEGCARIAAVL